MWERQRERETASGSCFHDFACQQQKSHLEKEAGAPVLMGRNSLPVPSMQTDDTLETQALECMLNFTARSVRSDLQQCFR